jgi:hypothetical protein
MAYIERQPTLPDAITNGFDRTNSLEHRLIRSATRHNEFTGSWTATSSTSVTVVSEDIVCEDKQLLEVYAHGLGSTNGANKYGVLVVYIDGSQMYADTLLKWGSSTAAVSNERRFSLPGSAIGTGSPNPNRLGGFVTVLDASTSFLSAGEHLIEMTLETSGTSASCTVTDLAIAYRIS